MAKAKKTNTIVKKSNALIRGQWTIESVWEPRLVALLASKIHVNDEDFKVYEFPVSDVLGHEYGGENLKELSNVVDRVMSRVVTIHDKDGRGWTKFNMFYRCRYRAKDGILELGFHPDLRPQYLNLKERFTQYSLAEFMALPSIYSQRIYEILKSWSSEDDATIDIDKLHNMLDTPLSLRRNFKDFRIRVLEKAHSDITEREGSSLLYEWEPVRKGARKVTAVRFIFRRSLEDLMPKKTVSDHEKLQKNSNACWEKKNSSGSPCEKPDMRKKMCKFCAERGRMRIALNN